MNKSRIFVERKCGFDIERKTLFSDIKHLYHIELKNLRYFNIYDIFDLDQITLNRSIVEIFSEPNKDIVTSDVTLNEQFIATELLPGQFDQRADSAIQCIKLINPSSTPKVISGKLITFSELTDEEINILKNYLINKIESREKDLTVLKLPESTAPGDSKSVAGFNRFSTKELATYYNEQSFAMSFEDLEFVQNYFKKEQRDPFETELKVLDTYWSDHCRHTTFETQISSVVFLEDSLSKEIEASFQRYLAMRKELNRIEEPVTLMDIATINARYERHRGNLEDIETSDEVNAASIYIDVDVDGVIEKWLLMFKNETHNHPTEIEPFGGASTCIGGAIRDPLSGRSYVYSAMRISGAGDINQDVFDTIEGKLPQRIISNSSADGYSSYGNQIGIPTTFVNEIHHDGYVAKRMEIGVVMGAAPASNVVREKPLPGDIVILLGGRTGRDGIGGATGSSKIHNIKSIETSSAEVQKGNAPEERKIQRLFRNPEATKLIKKSNDLGAGGISVAIGELADGLEINLNSIPRKYDGMNGTDLAISESQERMSVVIAREDNNRFIELCHKENIEATPIAVITEQPRLVMKWNNNVICDISREFIDTSGIRQTAHIKFDAIAKTSPFVKTYKGECLNEQILNMLKEPNIATKQGLDEMFDSTIGRTTVLAPYGGKYQLTKTQVSVHKIPALGMATSTVSMMAYGFNPYISEWSPYHGATYAVVNSIAKIIAAGGDFKGIRFTFQEYFERLNKEPTSWSKPLAALLGAMNTLYHFGLPAIGGKDSMSGTFHNISVPPSLVSFAIQTDDVKNVISNDLKGNSFLYLVRHTKNKNQLPDFDQLKNNFSFIRREVLNKNILSSYALEYGGLAEALTKASFGNKIGFNVQTNLDLFELDYGSILIETKEKVNYNNAVYLGKTNDSNLLSINLATIKIDDAIKVNQHRYMDAYPITHSDDRVIDEVYFNAVPSTLLPKNETTVKVLIPVFSGTNCEYDAESAFADEGAATNIFVFNNQTEKDIEYSINQLEKLIDESHIIMLSGGFSSGDEPDGSGKFIASVLRNENIEKAIVRFLKKKNLILGICNGFQALVKSGLLPYGTIQEIKENDPTLFINSINRHVSKFVDTKVSSVKSPWLSSFRINETHTVAISHGEGKFIIDEAAYQNLVNNNQIAFQYVDKNNRLTYNPLYNPSGSSYAIEGILSKDGLILGKMGHSERYTKDLFINIHGNKDQNLFRNAVNYFEGKGAL